MNRSIWIPLVILCSLGLAAIFGLKAYDTAQAAASTPTAPTKPATQGKDRGFKGSYTSQDLADALGITTDQLQAAYKSANDEALKEAVSAGLITQAQADELSARSVDGWMGRFPGLKDSSIDYEALLAKALNITTDQLNQAYQKAYTTALDRAVANGTLTKDEADMIKARNSLYTNSAFQASMKTAFENAVKQAVSDGVITQAQADQILSESANQTFGGRGDFGSKGFGGPAGFEGGRGGRFGGHGANSSDDTQTSPTPQAPSSSGGL